jgi:hypothetical protein
MRYDSSNTEGYTVIDDATGRTIKDVLWVDDGDLQYAVECSATVNFYTGTYTVDEVITTVKSVTINHAAREIHLNTPPIAPAVVAFRQPPTACRECTNECSCKRIGMCLRFKCGFGEVEAP